MKDMQYAQANTLSYMQIILQGTDDNDTPISERIANFGSDPKGNKMGHKYQLPHRHMHWQVIEDNNTPITKETPTTMKLDPKEIESKYECELPHQQMVWQPRRQLPPIFRTNREPSSIYFPSGSYPSPTPSGSSSPPPASPKQGPVKGPHCNRKYTLEEVDYIRFRNEDMGRSWGLVMEDFHAQFQGSEQLRTSNQCFSSRQYRDNRLPKVVKDHRGKWHLQFADGGKVVTIPAKIRKRKTVPDAPYTLVEKNPVRALGYSWVSAEMKQRAQEIIEQDERDESRGCLSEKGKWRKYIRLAESVPQGFVKPTKYMGDGSVGDVGKVEDE